MIADSIYQYIFSCPLLSDLPENKRGFGHIDLTGSYGGSDIGFFPSDDSESGICYINGDKERIFSFDIIFRKCSDTDIRRSDNIKLCERLTEWIDKNPPALPDDCDLIGIYADDKMMSEYDKTGRQGIYKLGCRVKYVKHYK